MMVGGRNNPKPIVHVPPWTLVDDPTNDVSFPFPVSGISVNHTGNADEYSPYDALAALNLYFPSNDTDLEADESGRESDIPVDAYSCDHFRMFEFKVRKCTRGRSHDWTECPFAHPGEKARRRDPRKFHYSGAACPDFRKGNCKKGDACDFAHGVFECWLHPARYRTQPCKDGPSCRRRVCFFAHSPDQLRILSPTTSGSTESYDGSPHRVFIDGSCAKALAFMSSPESASPPSESPPLSPMPNSLCRSLRHLQLNKVKSMPSSWGLHQVGSPGLVASRMTNTRPALCSLPSTPTGATPRSGIGVFDLFDKGGCEEEPVMERVESGRVLRAKMFEKLSRENPLDRVDPTIPSTGSDVGWVSELVK